MNAFFQYKNYKFQIDIKAINKDAIESKKIKLHPKEVSDIFVKMNIHNLNNPSKILTPNLEYIVAEKLIAFHKKYFDNPNEYRNYRHLYDIFMIFRKNLIKNNEKTWSDINEIYNLVIKNVEKDFNVQFKDNICFQKEIINLKEVINNLTILIESECYDNVKVNDVITFYTSIKY